jgi:alkylation response protein AidB-like acyl-CoA dehydrogenase
VATPEGDGYRVSGRWSLVSGCELAEWWMLLCRIEGEPPGERFVFVRAAEGRILDTWHVGGLRGTGSHDVVVEDVHVPASHTLFPSDGPTLDGALGRVPIIVNLAADFAAQTLGMARAALEEVTQMARTRITPGPAPDLRDRPAAQAGVPLHAAAVDAARSHLHRCVAALWDRASAGGDPDPGEIADGFAASQHAVDVARRCVESMFAAAGTRALYEDHPLERAHRDLHAMLRHVVAQPLWLEEAGRIRFGLPTQNPLTLV